VVRDSTGDVDANGDVVGIDASTAPAVELDDDGFPIEDTGLDDLLNAQLDNLRKHLLGEGHDDPGNIARGDLIAWIRERAYGIPLQAVAGDVGIVGDGTGTALPEVDPNMITETELKESPGLATPEDGEP